MLERPEGAEQARLIPPDLGFRLSEAEIQRLQPSLDVPALERLLGHIRPEFRGELLKFFTVDSGPAVLIPHDPFLATLVEAVYEPQREEGRRALERTVETLKRRGMHEPGGE